MKPIGPINSELSFVLFYSLMNIKKIFFKKRPTDYNLKNFWILAVQD